MAKLLNCPFCGGKAKIRKHQIESYEGKFFYQVRCTKCQTVRANSLFDTIYSSEEEAIEKAIKCWNTRASKGESDGIHID